MAGLSWRGSRSYTMARETQPDCNVLVKATPPHWQWLSPTASDSESVSCWEEGSVCSGGYPSSQTSCTVHKHWERQHSGILLPMRSCDHRPRICRHLDWWCSKSNSWGALCDVRDCWIIMSYTWNTTLYADSTSIKKKITTKRNLEYIWRSNSLY